MLFSNRRALNKKPSKINEHFHGKMCHLVHGEDLSTFIVKVFWQSQILCKRVHRWEVDVLKVYFVSFIFMFLGLDNFMNIIALVGMLER